MVWMAWRGVVWCGVAWRGVAWRGVAWRGVVWCGEASWELLTPTPLAFLFLSAVGADNIHSILK
jgi:hypothetical protein